MTEEKTRYLVLKRLNPDSFPRFYEVKFFETAHEVALFLWGKDIRDYQVIKGARVQLPTAEISEVERILEVA